MAREQNRYPLVIAHYHDLGLICQDRAEPLQNSASKLQPSQLSQKNIMLDEVESC